MREEEKDASSMSYGGGAFPDIQDGEPEDHDTLKAGLTKSQKMELK